MKKIGLLSYHASYNNGSALQAYALQQAIQDQGHECQIINYRHVMQDHMSRVINTKIINAGTIAKNLQNLLYIFEIKNRNRCFKKFSREQFIKSSEDYIAESDVPTLCNTYDAVVCGSDQIWNMSDSSYDKSTVYFLDFERRCKAISYAPSFGENLEAAKIHRKELIRMIRRFDCISMREKDAVDFLRENGVNATLVLDPTLILDREKWKELLLPRLIDEPYVFYYSINCKKFSIEATQNVSKQLGLKVVNPLIHPRTIGSGFKLFAECGPREFLSLLCHSEFVCTNSFHGTVFSILFGKPFIAIFDSNEGKMVRENRKANLLEQLGLQHHMVINDDSIRAESYIGEDYTDAYRCLDLLKQDSLTYLKNSLK